MGLQKGANVQILMGFEDTYKSAPSAGFILPVNSFGVKGSQRLNSAKTLRANRNPIKPFRGNRDVGGTIVIPADSIAMWYWAKLMFGDPTQSGEGPYVHEFKIGDTMPSACLEAAFTDLASFRYARNLGCKASQWGMTVGGDDELTSNLDIVGAVDSLETSAFDAAPTEVDFARVENFQAALVEGGSELANATEVSFQVNFGLDTDKYVVGSEGTRGKLPEGIVAVTGNVKALFEDDSLLAKAIAGTESSLKITVTESASSIMEVEFQELQYERNMPDVPGPQGLLVDLNFVGYYDNGSEESALVLRLTNNVDHS